MVITIASGKGGTGKTTVAANLAHTVAHKNAGTTWLVDCDVEAPNAALFLNPDLVEKKTVERQLPVIHQDKCTACGECVRACEYNALAVAGGKVLFFKELCHACGSCALVCPQGAITEKAEQVGMLEQGSSGDLRFAQGTLEVGFSSPTPVIRALKKWVVPEKNTNTFILDASPGASCPVVETLRGSDFALFVTEPTPFGLHDLKVVVELNKKEFKLPAGIVINKSGKNDRLIEDFAAEQKLPVLMRVPLSRHLAEAYSSGILLVDVEPALKEEFLGLFAGIQDCINKGTV